MIDPIEDSHRRFRGALSIPYFDGIGRIRAWRFRYLGDPPNGRGKYDAPKDQEAHLYGVEVTDRPRVYLTEGEFDALILRQLGLFAVGVPGTNNWKTEWRLLFRDSDEVIVVFDADPEKTRVDGVKYRPGQDAAKRVVRDISGVTHAWAVTLPEGNDVTDLYQSNPDLLWSLLL